MAGRILGPVLKVAVSAFLIWLAFRNVDLRDVGGRMLDIPLAALSLAVVMFLIQYPVCALRWQAVVRAIGAEMPLRQALSIFWIGAFFNQALPSSVGGDAVRIYKVYKAGVRLEIAASGVLLERAATVYSLVLIVLVMLPLLLGEVAAGDAVWIGPAVAGLAVVSTAGLGVVMALDRLPQGLHRWRLVRGFAVVAADARRVFLAPGNAIRVLGWSALGHANLCMVVYAVLAGLGEEVPYSTVLALFPLVVLVTTIPISIAGWGVREVSMIAAFALVGVTNEGATAASLLVGFLSAATSLPGGVLWLLESFRGRSGESDRDDGPVPGIPNPDKGTS